MSACVLTAIGCGGTTKAKGLIGGNAGSDGLRLRRMWIAYNLAEADLESISVVRSAQMIASTWVATTAMYRSVSSCMQMLLLVKSSMRCAKNLENCDVRQVVQSSIGATLSLLQGFGMSHLRSGVLLLARKLNLTLYLWPTRSTSSPSGSSTRLAALSLDASAAIAAWSYVQLVTAFSSKDIGRLCLLPQL